MDRDEKGRIVAAVGQRVKKRTLYKHNIEAQLVELMPSCNYTGTILLSLLGMMYGLCENPVGVSSDHFSQFSAGGEKYPDAIAMAMDDLNKRV